MGKYSKTITIDDSLRDEFKNVDNDSNLINDLLKDYFFGGIHLEEEQLKEELNKLEVLNKQNSKKENILKERLKKIQMKDKEMRDVFKDIPEKILLDFKEFNSMTEETLLGRFKDVYSKQYKIKWEEVLKAFKEFHGKRKDRE